jgi:CheY-like chemotaxis protein
VTEGSGDSTAPLVLVGDDEATVRDLVCEVLGAAGYRTLAASDGEEVVELALRHQPVLIAVDLMMPKMDGYTTVTRLRGHPLTAGIPVIVLTGQSNPLYRTLSRGVGATAHLTKPFSPSELLETVRRVLGGAAG